MENANGSMSKLPKFIMKTDDDIYVNLPNLLKLVKNDFYQRYDYYKLFFYQVLFHQKITNVSKFTVQMRLKHLFLEAPPFF